jgi:intracellular sulfur oxidation DsrE/DsrF family protein
VREILLSEVIQFSSTKTTNMRKLFFLALVAMITAGAALSQSNTAAAITVQQKDSATAEKFYFPIANYSDSTALSKAMPKLAEQVLARYHEANKRTYFENCINYYLLSDSYSKAIEMVDSVRKIADDKSYDVDVVTYALAKISEKENPGSFEAAFKTEFSKAFNELSFPKKVSLALTDSSAISSMKKDYASLQEKLIKTNKDSLSLEDARSLCDKYVSYSFNKKIMLLTGSLIDKKYRPTFPAIKAVTWAGAVPVEHIDEIPDPNMHYNMLFELTWFDTAAKKEIYGGLGNVARELNLHEANGIPRKNIGAVVVVHADGLYSLLSNEKYKKKYGVDNPNIPLIKELQNYGVKMIVCGQAMTFWRLEMQDLVPGIKQALTAQTVLSSYQLKNYVRF